MSLTNEELFEDFKQYFDAKLHQAFDDVATKDDAREIVRKEVHTEVQRSKNEMIDYIDARTEEVLDAIADTMEKRSTAVDEQLDDHEARIGRLEAA